MPCHAAPPRSQPSSDTLEPWPPRSCAAPARRALGSLAFALLLGALWLAGCTKLAPKPDPFAPWRGTWQPGYTVDADVLAQLPHYAISLTLNPTGRAYSGTMALELTVPGEAPLYELYFRTYPNLYAFGGNLQITGASIDGSTVNFAQAAEGSATRLALVTPLEPGKRARVMLSFTGSDTRESPPGQYTIFGYNDDVFSLTNFYPILAARRGDAWALDLPHPQGDVGFHDAALYEVTVTAPPGQTMVATGSEISRTVHAGGWSTTHYALGPAREFSLLMSPKWEMTQTESLGTTVRSYYRPEHAEAGLAALRQAVASMQIYSDRFGPYPYREMSIVEAPLMYHGMEFPGVSLIGTDVYQKYRKDLETLVVHEVAHNWWYNMVGSDQVLSPWQDEGLAEYSMYEYSDGRYGDMGAEKLRELRWRLPVKLLASRGRDAPIGLPVGDYKTQDYETLVYGKGALFFARLRDEMGPLVFKKFLRTYLDRFQWRIATPADLQAVAEEVSGKDLDALFAEWVLPPPQ